MVSSNVTDWVVYFHACVPHKVCIKNLDGNALTEDIKNILQKFGVPKKAPRPTY